MSNISIPDTAIEASLQATAKILNEFQTLTIEPAIGRLVEDVRQATLEAAIPHIYNQIAVDILPHLKEGDS